uniref:CUT domain-containing protein n=1 Tax=Caenorhabditis tropicalis TaxID=1561998 RepID=A0A1I7TRQ5_9PELO
MPFANIKASLPPRLEPTHFFPAANGGTRDNGKAMYAQTAQQYPAQQEVKPTAPQLTAHHGYMYGPQPSIPQLSQYPATASTAAPTPEQPSLSQMPLEIKQTAQTLFNDPDFQMLARSLQTGTGSIGYNTPISPRNIPPCSSDGRSVTIDHLRISPESLVQIARLAQAFGTNPDWKKLRLADMKSALGSQMHPTHQYAARSIGL